MVAREEQLIPVGERSRLNPGEKPRKVMCRFRTLGCYPCTGAVPSTAKTVPEIIQELQSARHSERITRIIDHDMDGSMEQKKREGYF
jgi:sulfate adenylyltransferase subunit 2